MSINLLKLLQDQMGSAVVDQASKFLGESSSNTSAGLNALLPSLLVGLMSKGSTESGASGIMDMITKGNYDGSILDNLGNVFSGGSSTSNFMNAGSLLTSSLFGGSKLGSVLDVVTKATGMRRSSSSSLMNLLAPIVMGLIGKQVKKGGLNASGLMNMLMGQKDHVAAALPAGMGSVLGFADLKGGVTEKVTAATSRTATAARDTVKETANVVGETAKTGASWIRWALPLVLLAGLGAWLFTRGGAEKITGAAGDMTEAAGTMAGDMKDGATKTLNAAGEMANDAAGTMKEGATRAGNAAAGAAGTMKDAAGNVVSGAKNAAGNMADGAKNAAGNVVSGAKNAADNMADGANKMADDAMKSGNKLGAKIKNAAVKTGDAVGDAAKATGDAVGNAASKVGGALSGAGQKTAKTFSSMFKSGSSAPAFTLHDITFDPTSNKITNFNKDEVEALAYSLKQNSDAKVEIQAFSNAGKNAIANKTIASARAATIKQMLTTLGVNAGQLSTKGMAAKDSANANAIQVVVK
jgi:outer membrane protein OmpA-like peptidoglycan-associated protein